MSYGTPAVVVILEYVSFFLLAVGFASLVTGAIGIARYVSKRDPRLLAASIVVGPVAALSGVLVFSYAYGIAF